MMKEILRLFAWMVNKLMRSETAWESRVPQQGMDHGTNKPVARPQGYRHNDRGGSDLGHSTA